MLSSPTPGSPTSICSRTSMPTWPSPNDHRLGTPDAPAIRSTRVAHFVASLVHFRYGLPGCSPPCTDRTGTPQPSGAFTTRLSTDWSPSPLLVITTTVTELLLLAGLAPAGMAASFAARSSESPPAISNGAIRAAAMGFCSSSAEGTPTGADLRQSRVWTQGSAYVAVADAAYSRTQLARRADIDVLQCVR